MRRISIFLVPLLFLTLVAPPTALRAEEGADAPERYAVSFDSATPMETFLKSVSKALDLPLVWDPKARAIQGKEIAGALEFRGTKAEIFDAVRSLLTFYELVIVPVGSDAQRRYLVMDARQTSSIVKLKPRYVVIDEKNADELAQQDGLFITTTIPVKHMENLRDARNALNRIVTGQNIGNVTEVPAARAFVVTDFAPNVIAIWRLLKEMDVPASQQAGRVFRAIGLQHANAVEAAATLQAHFNANSGRRKQPQGRQPMPMTPHTPLQIHADARLNLLLISGPEEDVMRVVEVVSAMDRKATPQSQMPVETEIEVVRLQNVNAIETQEVISRMLKSSFAAWTLDGKVPLPAVVGHREINALILQATPAALKRLRRLITDLDAPKPKED